MTHGLAHLSVLLLGLVMPLGLAQTLITPLLAIALLGGVIGASAALLVVLAMQRRGLLEAQQQAARTLARARSEAEALRDRAQAQATVELAQRRELLEQQTESTRRELRTQEEALRTLERQTQEARHAAEQQLQHTAGLSRDEARTQLRTELEAELARETSELIARKTAAAQAEAKERATAIIVDAMQRCAAPAAASTTVTTIDLPNEEMKGRIIGREGRNIRAFEKASGAEVIVDDTPGVVALSCFDPIRREIAERSMRKLIEDGRIHPSRIEEIVAEQAGELDKQIRTYGEQACLDADVGPLQPEVVNVLGRLQFRASYGQNVLAHSVEVAALCNLMASELKLDAAMARRAGLLHDIGKALDREQTGAHTAIGAEFLRRHGEPEPVINAAAGHHHDVPATSIITPIVVTADAISASRPGARRESLEKYLKRMSQLETIAKQQPGVESSFAVQAGREIRVIVDANKVDDAGAVATARAIARQIERELSYAGEIRIILIREQRVVEYAR